MLQAVRTASEYNSIQTMIDELETVLTLDTENPIQSKFEHYRGYF